MAWTANRGRFIGDLLSALGDPNTRGNRRALSAWAQAEGGSAAFNPFNTTQSAPGAGSYNSVGVRNYGSYQQGLHATLQTLRNGHYGSILNALKQGNNPLGVANAIGASPWGTSGSLVAQILRSGGITGGAKPVPHGGNHGPSLAQNPNHSALIQQLLSNNYQFATTGRIDPVLQQSAFQNGLTKFDQKALGNFNAPSGMALPGKVNKIIQVAKNQIGTPYVWGGSSKGGFDCSGLIQYAYAKAGIALPRTTYDQINRGKKVAWGSFRPGDLIFSDFEGTGKPTHVVMYIGNGKVIAAPHTGDHVRIEDVSLFRSNFVGARRILGG